ncbi:hypothetical protein [Pseudooceanicola sp.]|uniref:hypothetical protein n=1 Tax=Pseudooceanicola sp. TaxID=1914328 RepID=UPI0026384DD5|nr:hypothetical protein [Pseudooceanicola sp.]MDF1855071.1 hypothetical protein [Pseudooceanicola sp.]
MTPIRILALALISGLAIGATGAAADAPEIVSATAAKHGLGWNIEVTLKHPDSGWDHYADGWQVLDENGKVLAFRKLGHPHVTEQPFARALHSVMVPDGTKRVFLRAHCSHGDFSTELTELQLER